MSGSTSYVHMHTYNSSYNTVPGTQYLTFYDSFWSLKGLQLFLHPWSMKTMQRVSSSHRPVNFLLAQNTLASLTIGFDLKLSHLTLPLLLSPQLINLPTPLPRVSALPSFKRRAVNLWAGSIVERESRNTVLLYLELQLFPDTVRVFRSFNDAWPGHKMADSDLETSRRVDISWPARI